MRCLQQYMEALDRFHLDGLLYPTAQMPPPDETMPQDGKLSGGPHSETGWVNKIGVPAVALQAAALLPKRTAVWTGDQRASVALMATCWAGRTASNRRPGCGVRLCWSKAA